MGLSRLSAEVWSAIMMTAATGLAAFMVWARGNWLFPLVFGWAFVGIADRLYLVVVVAEF